MPATTLFPIESPVAQRQPKTDRLVLERILREAIDLRIDESEILAAHAVLVHWADLESTGRLARLNETQMQGDFLAQVFGQALGYASALEKNDLWHRQQHHVVAGETPDAVLGFFRPETPIQPLVIVELKGPAVHLDRDRSNGRTAVSQLWDYLVNTPPECRWGVLSNIVSFRLYERSCTKRRYEHFSLQSLRELDTFKRFYRLFHRRGLIDKGFNGLPQAVQLLQDSTDRQREVGEELYEAYSEKRRALIEELHFQQGHPIDAAIEMAQRLLDRIIFIAFCEDRQLLTPETILKAYGVASFTRHPNPRWRSFQELFRCIDQGEARLNINKYNGGLFAEHPVDGLELDDVPWTGFFKSISKFSFADEVNLDVLGHLFERSITEVEKLKLTGFFGGNQERARQYAEMPQSEKRKQLGVYYTSTELTSRIVQYTVEELIDERFAALAAKYGVPPEEAARGKTPDNPQYWHDCLACLRNLKIVDPACGSGAFLFQAYNTLEARYLEVIGHIEPPPPPPTNPKRKRGTKLDDDKSKQVCEALPAPPSLASQVPTFILQENLYGVDLSPEAVEITQLALWIRSATRGQLLARLSENIVHGNSLVHDPAVHPAGFDWRARFPAVFEREESGFDCVIGNPPWERIKLQEREFFSLPAPEIATATNAAKRRQLVAKLEQSDQVLFDRYEKALAAADALLTYCRHSEEYPLTGKGDINTYAVFAELAYRLVAPHGRVGLLVPSGIASDMTTKDFFAAVAESNRLIRLYDFENKRNFFPEVHASFKFSIINFGGPAADQADADYVFFAHQVEELGDQARHIALSGKDIKLLNPNTRTCPIFRTQRDAEITKRIYRRVPILIDQRREGPTGNPWGIQFQRMFDQTNDAELFHEAGTLQADGYQLKGNRWIKGKKVFLPLYEAKMVQDFDHRAASVIVDSSNWFRQGQTDETSLVNHQNPEFQAIPRWWIDPAAMNDQSLLPAYLAFKNVTSPTNRRTMIAAMIPRTGVGNSAPLILVDGSIPPRSYLCLLANLNAFALDYVARGKIGNVNLNFFLIEQFPMFSPDTYSKRCPWANRTKLETWISERVLKLTCTAEDMLPLAEACEFKSGSFKTEYGGRLNKWDEAERAELMAELDAAYFHLYGLGRDDAEYILSTFKGIHDELPLLGGASTSQRILQKYAELSSAG